MTQPANDAASPHASHGERAPLPTDTAGLPELGPAYEDTLDAGLRSLGLDLDPGARAATAAQARLLLAWNQHINLTAIRTPEGVARLHVLDSLTAVRVLRDRVPARPSVVDLGSGGGYPGLPLAVTLPAGRLTLVDSVSKKTRFLEVVAAAARGVLEHEPQEPPAIEVVTARAEQLAADEHRESWDVVTVRAVGTLLEVVELGLPLLRRGGLLVCWKRETGGPDIDGSGAGTLEQEIRETTRLLTELGGEAPEVIPVETPGLPGHRLVLVHKVQPTPRRFPRLPAERRRRLLR